MAETIVISLGGSLIVPEEIDIDFLKAFRSLIVSQVKKGKKFLIITGGGKIARKYQSASRELVNPTNEDLDWVGIACCSLNAEFLRVIFGDLAHSKVIFNFSVPFFSDKPVIIGAAYKPGRSSDWDAILGAKLFNSKRAINLSNTDYIYDSDPKTNPNAKKIEAIAWKDYRAMIPKEWNAGLNTPFDPIASELAEKEGISVVTMNGKSIENLNKCLNGEKFLGSTIS